VLGMLLNGELSGYEMQKQARHGVGYLWAPAKTRIYAALPRLVDEGLATSRNISQTTKPDKQVYRLTAKGREALREWLNHADVDPPPYKNPLLLKVFLGEVADPDALAAQIRERGDAARTLLRELEALDAAVPHGHSADFFPSLTRRWGYAYARALASWADDVERDIERWKNAERPSEVSDTSG
jgi:DNA-binding PadR family transcriptional regulator